MDLFSLTGNDGDLDKKKYRIRGVDNTHRGNALDKKEPLLIAWPEKLGRVATDQMTDH